MGQRLGVAATGRPPGLVVVSAAMALAASFAPFAGAFPSPTLAAQKKLAFLDGGDSLECGSDGRDFGTGETSLA